MKRDNHCLIKIRYKLFQADVSQKNYIISPSEQGHINCGDGIIITLPLSIVTFEINEIHILPILRKSYS